MPLVLQCHCAPALIPPQAPACNLTGWWCCEETQVFHAANNTVTTSASYGTGIGVYEPATATLRVTFSNAQPPKGQVLNGTVNTTSACGSIAWSNGAEWDRTPPPPPPFVPTVPAPSWATTLSIYELNPLAWTSPNGTGPGWGSGTWASTIARLPHLAALGVSAIWLAGYSNQTAHFYGIKSVYAAVDQTFLDPALGSEQDFADVVTACHALNIRVLLDVIGHGVVNESPLVAQHPDWFSGGSWGMRDFNYSSPGFLAYWTGVWEGYINTYGIDGVRIDVADMAFLPVWNTIAQAATDAGRPIVVMGESNRYHMSQHDLTAPVTDVPSALAAIPQDHCLNTMQFSCHDHGWESGPGNYFFLQGSRAAWGYMGPLSPFIPLWLGGEEYWEDPVQDVPLLQQDLYGTSGKPGGWMYGSVRQWAQIDGQPASDPHAAMLQDFTALLAVASAHADVLHHDRCTAQLLPLPLLIPPAQPLGYVPYVRYLPSRKAVLVIANGGTAPAGAADITVTVPLATMGLAGKGSYNLTWLYGGVGTGYSATVSEAELGGYPVYVPPDGVPRGGLTVLLLLPS